MKEPTHSGAAPGERLELLDALRGFALLGILLANIRYWSGWIFMGTPGQEALAGAHGRAAVETLHHLLIDGKFYSIFSLLFGIGFALQLHRLERRGADGLAIFRRRMLVLLAIALVHFLLIWDGDILHIYALIGLLLPLARRWSDRSLLIAAAALMLLPVPGITLIALSGLPDDLGLQALGTRISAAVGILPGGEIAWMQREDFAAYLGWVMTGPPFSLGLRIESWRFPKVLAMMLLGLWVGRRLIDGRLPADRRLLRKLATGGLIVGLAGHLAYLPLAGATAATPLAKGLQALASIVAITPLAIGYAASFTLLWSRLRPALRLLVAPGRMALTNYIGHSLLGIALFFGVGAGLVGRLTPPEFYGVALLIFSGQILLSHLWLARFEQGPLEKLWRLGTYGRRRAAKPLPA